MSQLEYIVVGTGTSYNPATGSGNSTVKVYVAKPGVTCNGTTFVNTANEPVFLTATSHFVVSENGNRSDANTLAIHATSLVDFVAGEVSHTFVLRQTQ